LTLTIYNLVQAISCMIAPNTVSKCSLKKVVIMGTILLVGATFLLSLSPNVHLMYVLQAVMGFGAGLIGTVTVTTMINHWFNKDNAFMVSIVMGCSGIIGAIMSMVIGGVISASGWRTAYRITALIMLILNLPALLLPIAMKPEEVGKQPFGGPVSVLQKKTSSDKAVKVSGALMVIVLIFSFCASMTTALPQHFPGLAQAAGMAKTGSLMISVCMVMNTAGKVLLGILIDKIGSRKAVSIFCAAIFLGALLIFSIHNSAIYLLAAGLYGLCYSIATVGPSTITREMFGSDNYAKVYPKCALSTTISNALGTTLIGVLYDASGSYTGTMILMMGLCIAAIVLLQSAYASRQKMV
jgi:MFS family permease